MSKKDDSSLKWTILEAEEADRSAQLELEGFKNQLFQGGNYVSDLASALTAEQNTRFGAALAEIERVFISLDNRLGLRLDPSYGRSLELLKIALQNKPEMIPYLAIVLRDNEIRLKNVAALVFFLDKMRGTVKKHSEDADRNTMLNKWNDWRSRIMTALESQERNPDSQRQETRYRVSQHGDFLQPIGRTSSVDQAKLRVLRLYLSKIEKFIVFIVDHPEAVGLQQAGYDFLEEQRVRQVLDTMNS